MKKFVLAVLALAIFATPAVAEVKVEGDVYGGIYDKYMWRGYNLSSSQPVLQMGTDISFKGFTVSYWSNTMLSSSTNGDFVVNVDGEDINVWNSDETTKTDITFDYTFNVHEILTVSVGDIMYNFNAPGNTHELYLGLAFNTILSPSLTI